MSNELNGLGRGGRGARLLAALSLQNRPRRPGENIEDASAPETVPAPVLGRGAFLKQLAEFRGRGAPISVPEASIPKVIGRGRGLGLTGVSSRGTEAKTECEPAALIERPSTPPTSLSEVSSKFEELIIGNYSGTSGKQINIEVNYVRLNILGNAGIHEYHVSFVPSVDSRRMKFRLINQEPVRNLIGKVKTFDGSKLYLPLKLQLPLSHIDVELPTDNSSIRVDIKYVKVCQHSDLLHLYNVLFKKVMNILKMTQVRQFLN